MFAKKSVVLNIQANQQEQSSIMLYLLTILVLLLHIGIIVFWNRPVDRARLPLKIMEVALISVPNEQIAVNQPTLPPESQPTPELPKPVVNPVKDKMVIKKTIKKKTPVIPKPIINPVPNPAPVDNKPLIEDHPVVAPPPPPPVQSVPTPSIPKISTGVVPLVRVPPKYPPRAAERHIEGWVKVEFTISAEGKVRNAVVVESQPTEVFDDAALKAISQWSFKEKIVEGVAVEQRAIQTLQFKLSN